MADFDMMMMRIKTQKLQQVVNMLPREVRTLGVQFIKARFRAGGWYDKTFMPWKKRKSKGRGSVGRAILVQSGRLRNSIRGDIRGTDVSFSTDVPYAQVHNSGGRITRYARSETFVRKRIVRGPNKGRFKKGKAAGQGFTFRESEGQMPQRQYMGESAHMNRLVTRTIENKVKRVFK